MNQMTFDEFSLKLRIIKAEYLKEHGEVLETIEQLEKFLDRRLARPKKRGLRSLRGIL